MSETTKRRPEYLEEPEATENFENGMRILFQAPKPISKKKKLQDKPTASQRKPKFEGSCPPRDYIRCKFKRKQHGRADALTKFITNAQ